jgi:transmembrane sensor
MDALSRYDDLPWDLILSALQGTLLPEEEELFRQWLAQKEDYRVHYEKLQRLWKQGLADYGVYVEADEKKAWKALQQRMENNKGAVLPLIKRWMAVAAVVLLAAGATWWYRSANNGPLSYETAGEQKKIALADGSTVVITPQTRIEIARDYNKTGRTVTLLAGEARFDVAHLSQQPFVVDVDNVSVRDIGTNFSVQKTKDSIRVSVSGGKVAFVKKETGETREIPAGNSLVYYTFEHRFGDIHTMETADSGADSLRFYNAPLSGVIAVLQKMSGKKIGLSDTALGQKKLTIDLKGVSFDDAMKIICASLNLDFSEKDGEYRLKNRDSVLRPK